ncbi:MAG: hypothetical protein COU63_04320 [Candidatus Pacebacteria bacterium CG10_big_fil_rev_8_21_14_0_10_36_11]|nr:triosephosphate isomerase [Candidatus Pacearchaeota archaeon]OIP74118.1 MAG: hypothetical protein AUK08_02595 [Candidatus Pacebacteria bacterium CG2_30_36_39]PIR64486.1 MAG: hypothetical protein COU63_04320 [Candidatus Pacebacteria bacterium CG10_big_fil_rev_8_21_14_0_10_36_11]PJC42579.1 MAG: hypothetical protein CO040_03740 [Candidatus Pacebacteria bacterium CG_4_9_14_0_2_um_filter_36_8]
MRKIIFGNWKANKSLTQAREWLEIFNQELAEDAQLEVEGVIAPAFPLLSEVKENLPKQISLGLQDISAYPAGSYTGGVSVQNIAGFGVKYALIAHSERRKYFTETSTTAAQKVTQLLSIGITPIVCVERETIDEQIARISVEELSKCIIAYEPSASIGSGNNASLSDVTDFKEKVKRLCGDVPYLYGGSVNEQSIAEYLFVTDGVIIGTASLEAKQFVSVLRAAQGKTPIGS